MAGGNEKSRKIRLFYLLPAAGDLLVARNVFLHFLAHAVDSACLVAISAPRPSAPAESPGYCAAGQPVPGGAFLTDILLLEHVAQLQVERFQAEYWASSEACRMPSCFSRSAQFVDIAVAFQQPLS
jgi:hypothetical protein